MIYTVPTQTSRSEKSANQNSIKLLKNQIVTGTIMWQDLLQEHPLARLPSIPVPIVGGFVGGITGSPSALCLGSGFRGHLVGVLELLVYYLMPNKFKNLKDTKSSCLSICTSSL